MGPSAGKNIAGSECAVAWPNTVDERNDISEEMFLRELRDWLPASAQWAFADESLLLAVRRREGVSAGSKTTALHRLLRFLDSCGLLFVGMAVVAAYKGAGLVIRQARRRRRAETMFSGTVGSRVSPEAVFVGFGARAEEALFEKYRWETQGEVLRVNQHDLAAAAGIGYARPRDLWQGFLMAIRNVREAMSVLPPEHASRRADFVTAAAKRIPDYVYAKAWWQDVMRKCDVREVCFIIPDTMAFAVISEGARSVFVQHGLLSKSLLLPAFDEVWPLTSHERNYLQRQLPNALVHPAPAIRHSAASHTPRLLIASGNRSLEEMMLVASLMQVLANRGIVVHVRLFPGEDPARFWGALRLQHDFHLETASGSFGDLLDDLRPSAVASWGSTALAEALYRGVLPICVASYEDRLVEETVYPLFRRCLKWPEEQSALHESLGSQPAYQATLDRLQSGELLPFETRDSPLTT